MIRKYYALVFYGEVAEGYNATEVRHTLAAQPDLDANTRECLLAGKTAIMRKDLDQMAATMLQTNCEIHGAICQIELARVETPHSSIDVSKLCQLEFRGEILVGHRLADVQAQLRTRLNASPQAMEQLFSGKPMVIQKDVDYETALQIQTIFEQTGAICQMIQSDKELPPEKTFKEPIFRLSNLELMVCPKCGCKQPFAAICKQCGIVAQHFTKRTHRVEETPVSDEQAVVIVEAEIGGPTIPIWQIAVVGNILLLLLVSVLGISLQKLLVSVSLAPEMHKIDVRYTNWLALLWSNAQVIVLTAVFLPLGLFLHKLYWRRDHVGLRIGFLLIIFLPLGAIVMIDIFAKLMSGIGFGYATFFVLKGLVLSAIGYGIGFLCFLPILMKRAELPPASGGEVVQNITEEISEDAEAEETGLDSHT